MKDPKPIKWACGECGAEMARVFANGGLMVYCGGYFCKQSKVPFQIETAPEPEPHQEQNT